MKSRRLSAIAEWINSNLRENGYEAKIEKSFCNTDSKIKGTRFRRPGKGRYGNKLLVLKNGNLIFSHDAAETYRSNDEVEFWLQQELKKVNI